MASPTTGAAITGAAITGAATGGSATGWARPSATSRSSISARTAGAARRDAFEPEVLPRRRLGHDSQIGQDDRRDDGVAARRLMIGEQDDRCSARGYLDRPGHDAAAQKLAARRLERHAGEPDAHPV